MKKEARLFEEFLEKKGLRDTLQRELILEEFLKTEEHITAAELYDKVKQRDSAVGQATVYRVLKLFCEAGLAREVDFSDGMMRYEHHYGHSHHDHLVCRGCGKTVEVVDTVIEELQKRLSAQYGFQLTGHEMYLYGICEECRRR
ncbi:MAG: transcriptional repressor [Thermodesulfobacteriota bacterium]